MNGKGRVQRTGEYLVARASRYLPASIREARQQEWMAELPAILHDPAVRPAARRAARMLLFAADTFRGAAVARYTAAGRHVHRDADGKARYPAARQGLTALLLLLVLPLLIGIPGYGIYAAASGPVRTTGVPVLVSALVSFTVCQLFIRTRWWRRIAESFWFISCAVIVLGSQTGLILQSLAGQFGWARTLLFSAVYYVFAIILIVSLLIIAVVCAIAVQQRRQRART